MSQGLFVTLEGVDGAGKSTHLDWLADWFRARGRSVCQTREPGGTPLGEHLRELVLHQTMTRETEALVMFAARAEHLAQVIRPALAAGQVVLCDRFTDASYAYQCGGRGLEPGRLAVLEDWVHGDLQPHLTLLFDVVPQVAEARRTAARAPDRFEAERDEFHQRVRQAYLERASQFPDRVRRIDGGVSIDQVRVQLAAQLDQLLGAHP